MGENPSAREPGYTCGTRKRVRLPRVPTTGRLTACAGSCGPGSLHFVNGIYESHRNRAPVILIASQVASTEFGMDFPHEVEFRPVYRTSSCCSASGPSCRRKNLRQVRVPRPDVGANAGKRLSRIGSAIE
ncbi:MAG TPA: thiamine pyrophosphate-binding protein [Acetobacteraceae bacterium]|nr:thiamine pyrophosphate-binding protein [Acetobacteraceae bacterium]